MLKQAQAFTLKSCCACQNYVDYTYMLCIRETVYIFTKMMQNAHVLGILCLSRESVAKQPAARYVALWFSRRRKHDGRENKILACFT